MSKTFVNEVCSKGRIHPIYLERHPKNSWLCSLFCIVVVCTISVPTVWGVNYHDHSHETVIRKHLDNFKIDWGDYDSFENYTKSHQKGDSTDNSEHLQINKCCPFHQRYKNNGCVDMEKGITHLMTNISSLIFLLNGNNNNTPTTTEDKIRFRFKVSIPECEEMTEKIICMGNAGDDLSGNSKDSSNVFVISHERNHLIWQDDADFMNTVQFEDFCLDQINETTFIALLCKPTCSEKKPCVRKCCSPDSVLDLQTLSCVATKKKWSPYLFNNSVGASLKDDPERQIQYTYGLPNCSTTYLISPREIPTEKMYALVNGSLTTTHKGSKFSYSPDIYCIDGSADAVPVSASSHLDWDPLDQIAIICFPENYEDELVDNRPKLETFIFISVFFYALTAIVYLVLWKHENIHGWMQFAYIVSCLVAFSVLGILKLKTEYLCIALGALLHFSFLSEFFWMTSMTFNFWWTFRGCESSWVIPNGGSVRRFAVFALFSWGMAGAITFAGFILDNMNDAGLDDWIVLPPPRIGERNCFLYGYEEQRLYFYGPLCCLLVVDLVFFFLTIYLLSKIRRQESRFATQEILKREKKSFVVFGRFFILLGILWIIDVFCWHVLDNTNSDDSNLNIFHTIGILTACEGVLTFIVLICTPEKYRRLKSLIPKIELWKKNENFAGLSEELNVD